jgi:signal transduction histidine kinase
MFALPSALEDLGRLAVRVLPRDFRRAGQIQKRLEAGSIPETEPPAGYS